MRPSIPHEDEAGGHYVTSGLTLVGLGALGLGVAALIGWLELDFRYIEAPALTVTASIFVITGALMIGTGRKGST